VTIHVPMPRSAPTEVEGDGLPLASFAGIRLALVLWGGLLLVDLGRSVHAPAYVDLTLIALLVAVSSVRMRAGTALAAAAIGWLLVDGFVTHRLGTLGYDGTPDLARLALLAGVAVLASRKRR
jgi:hypothetical protein